MIENKNKITDAKLNDLEDIRMAKPTYEQLEQRVRELELAELENKRIAEALRDSNDKLTALFQSSPMAIIILDPDGNVRLWNPAAEKMFGWKESEVIGCFHPIVPKEKKSEHGALRERVLSGESFDNVELLRRKKDGSEIYISVSTAPLKDSEGNISGIMSVNVDVTERKRAEEKIFLQSLDLQESKAKFEGIVENLATGITLSDLNGKILQTNPAHQKIFGYSSGEITSMLFSDFTHPDDIGKHQSSYDRLLSGEIDHFRMEKRFIHKDGHTVWANVLVSLVRDNDNKPLFVVGMAEDITSRRQTEEKLRESEKRFKDLTEMLPEAVFETDFDINLTYANRQAFSLFGYTDQDLEKGLNGLDLLVPEDREKARLNIEKQLQKKKSGASEYKAVAKDGLVFPIILHASPIMKEGTFEGFRGIIIDITERKRAEIELQKQLGRLKSLYTINQTITASLNLNVTLNVFLKQVVDQLQIDAAAILLLNKETKILEHIASRGFRSDALKYTRLRVGESNAGRAAHERRIITISDLRDNIDGFVSSKLFSDEDFVTYLAVPLIAKGNVMGVLEIFNRSFFTPETDWLSFLETITMQGAIALDNANLFTNLQQSNASLSLAYDTTIEGWSRALDLRDKETEGHAQRVTQMTLRIASEFGVTGDDLIHMKRGALLHDIGKMGIPDSILLKPGRLDAREREIMERHPIYARDLLYPIEYLRPAIDIPYYHHEKWDGTGYPEGLKGDSIPFAARVFALVDVWDALSSVRPYRPAWSKEQVIDYIDANSKTHFDPSIVEKFLAMDL